MGIAASSPVAEEVESAPEAGAEVVIIDFADLEAGMDLTSKLAAAFCEGGLGLCAVRGVPGFAAARRRLLPLARTLARLPAEALEKYELPETFYTTGWSRGREKFNGRPDLAKGSFYANPIFDDPANGDEEIRSKFPFAASRNIWPQEVPDLEAAFKAMGNIIYEATKPVVQQCDRLVSSRCEGNAEVLYEKTFTGSRMVLGRLLHYYAGQADSWCGWHNDNSVITGLVPGMWLNEETGEETDVASSSSGLRVCGRDGAVVQVRLPGDCLGLQIGEAAQILSGGVLRATPHFVQGHISRPGEVMVSRESFALFMEPQWDSCIGPPKGASYEDVLRGEEVKLIPPLSKRLKPDPNTKQVEFGKLLGDSFTEYYKHNNPENVIS